MAHRPATYGHCPGTTGAGVSTENQDVVPPVAGVYEWTAVHDFWTSADGRPEPWDGGHHPGVYIRVHFRDQQWGTPEETRFGTIVYAAPDGDGFRGYLQTTGDSVPDPSQAAYCTHRFSLSNCPWPEQGQPTRWYRVQILERQLFVGQFPVYKWQTAWTGPDMDHAVFQGGLPGWISDDQVRGTGVRVPPLFVDDQHDSRILFGDADGQTGWMHTEFVGTTASWD